MQRTPHACPHCRQPIWLHSDMWGPYYLCEDCGWTAEDDEQVAPLKLDALPPWLTAGVEQGRMMEDKPGGFS